MPSKISETPNVLLFSATGRYCCLAVSPHTAMFSATTVAESGGYLNVGLD